MLLYWHRIPTIEVYTQMISMLMLYSRGATRLGHSTFFVFRRLWLSHDQRTTCKLILLLLLLLLLS